MKNITGLSNALFDLTGGQSVTIATLLINAGFELELTWRREDHDYRFIMSLSESEYNDLNGAVDDLTDLYVKILYAFRAWLFAHRILFNGYVNQYLERRK